MIHIWDIPTYFSLLATFWYNSNGPGAATEEKGVCLSHARTSE